MFPPFARAWLLVLALSLPGCGLLGERPPEQDSCAPAAAALARQVAGSGVAPSGLAPRRSEVIGGLRSSNLNIQRSQAALSQLFECRAGQAREIRAEHAAGRIWRRTAEARIARVRVALREDIEGALGLSERIGSADATLVAAAAAPPRRAAARGTPVTPQELRQETELRELAATNIARRDGFVTLVLVAGLLTEVEMEHAE